MGQKGISFSNSDANAISECSISSQTAQIALHSGLLIVPYSVVNPLRRASFFGRCSIVELNSATGTVFVYDSDVNPPPRYSLLQSRQVCDCGISSLSHIVPSQRPSSTIVCLCCWDGIARLYDFAHRRVLTSLKGHSLGLTQSCYFQNRSILATGSEDKTISLWAVDSRSFGKSQRMKRLSGHEGWIDHLRHSEEIGGFWSERLLSASYLGQTRVWDLQRDGQQIGLLNSRTGSGSGSVGTTGIEISPSGDQILTSSEDSVRLWDSGTFGEIELLDVSEIRVRSIMWSRDHEHLIVCGGHGSVVIFDHRRLSAADPVEEWETTGEFVNSLTEIDGRQFAGGQVVPKADAPVFSTSMDSSSGLCTVWDFDGRERFETRIAGKCTSMAYIPSSGNDSPLPFLRKGRD